jgi:dGTPase
VKTRWPDLSKERQTHEVQRRLITFMIEDAIASSRALIEDIAPLSVADVRSAGRTLVAFSPDVGDAEKQIKGFLFSNVYRAPSVMRPVKISEDVVEGLFRYYMDKNGLPKDWAKRYDGQKNDRARARVIADYIAGMTAPFAIHEYQRLFDESLDLS